MLSFSIKTQQVIAIAKKTAQNNRHKFVSTEHLLLGILEVPDCSAVVFLSNFIELSGTKNGNLLNLKDSISKAFRSIPTFPTPKLLDEIPFSPKVKQVMTVAGVFARRTNTNEVNTLLLLLGILDDTSGLCSSALKDTGIDIDLIKIHLLREIDPDLLEDSGKELEYNASIMQNNSGKIRGKSNQISEQESYIEQFTHNLTESAAQGKLGPIIGRDKEIDRALQILSRKRKNNPVLIGEPGVGKTAIVEGIAQRIVAGDVPDSLYTKHILALDMALLVAGTVYRGQFEERLKGLLEELAVVKSAIVFIDELHTIVGAGSTTGSLDASNILKPALSRGEITCIGATTIDEYRKHVEKDGALERRFQSVLVGEPSRKETFDILKGLKPIYEEFHNVKYTQQCINCIIECADKYIPERNFPDKAIDILDETGARARFGAYTTPVFEDEYDVKLKDITVKKNQCVEDGKLNDASKHRAEEIKLLNEYEVEFQDWVDSQNKIIKIQEDQVRDFIYQSVGIPINILTEDESKKLRLLDMRLKRCVIGQNKAIDSIVRCIQRSRIGLNDPERPIGSFLFLGTTGIGKTWLAKNIAKQLYGSEKSLIQFDMSELMEKHSVSKIIGSPPGYVGHDDSNNFLEQIRKRPHSVILFDEIEKAHPDILNVLLQVFEEGQLTDSSGRQINFKNCIIILTSNIGSNKIHKDKDHMGFGDVPYEDVDIHGHVMKELKNSLSPEFLNRLDEVVVFNTLKDEELHKIFDIEVRKALSRAKQSLKLKVTYDIDIISWILGKNENKKYGARPIKRLIKTYIQDTLTKYYIKNISTVLKTDTLHISIIKDKIKVTQHSLVPSID
jgi:ATP-dependent Clp protease ATP-binding subunit ClpC